MTWHTAIAWLTSTVALAAIGYQLAALIAVSRFFAKPAAATASDMPVTILKPLYGAEPGLCANLAGFLDQNHSGPLQMICGAGSADDSAIPAVEALIAAYSQADVVIVARPHPPMANGKIGNLANMAPFAAHEVLILSDSDMVVGRDYLPMVLAALARPGVGAVSCLYVGRGDTGFWSRLGAAAISWQMMPNMVMGLATGMARPCMGSTIALRRETLAAIGGFARFGDVLADDYAMGEAVAGLGLSVAIPQLLLVHAGTEASARAVWRHHLRWAVTIRGLKPAEHWGSVLTHTLPLTLLAMVFAPQPGLLLFATALAARLAMAGKVKRLSPTPMPPLWLLPLADCFEFGVFCASLFARNIDWRGVGLTMGGSGRIHARAGQ